METIRGWLRLPNAMKHFFTLILLCLCLCLTARAQSPVGSNYITVAWNPIPVASSYTVYAGLESNNLTMSWTATSNQVTVLAPVGVLYIAATSTVNGLECPYSAVICGTNYQQPITGLTWTNNITNVGITTIIFNINNH
jgi:hypothetical protein